MPVGVDFVHDAHCTPTHVLHDRGQALLLAWAGTCYTGGDGTGGGHVIGDEGAPKAAVRDTQVLGHGAVQPVVQQYKLGLQPAPPQPPHQPACKNPQPPLVGAFAAIGCCWQWGCSCAAALAVLHTCILASFEPRTLVSCQE